METLAFYPCMPVAYTRILGHFQGQCPSLPLSLSLNLQNTFHTQNFLI